MSILENCSYSKPYGVIELFAGAGGLALGLEMAGFETKLAVEINKWASQTLKKNRPHWNILQKDIQEVTKDGIKNYLKDNQEIDLLSGGYPCQSFSYAGKKLGLEDTRGTLFYEFAEVLKEIKPKLFLAENVIRKDIKAQIGVDYTFPKPHKNQLMLRDILKDVPSSPCASYNEKKKEVLKYVKPGGCWRDLPDDVAREYMKTTYFMGGGRTGIARRLSWDEPGLTVLCTPAQKQTERCHPDELRPFSVRENARIQSFPDEWEFEGSIAEQYKQIGNAVPVNLAKEVGLSLIRYLNKLKEVKKMREYNLSFI